MRHPAPRYVALLICLIAAYICLAYADRSALLLAADNTGTPVESRGRSAEPSAAADAPLLSPELRRIQQALGGSVVQQFDSLPLPAASPAPASFAAPPPSGDLKAAVKALRDAAWRLDVAAYRLESLDLFRQADALREQSRQLRLDARHMIERRQRSSVGAPSSSPQPETVPTPALPRTHAEPEPSDG